MAAQCSVGGTIGNLLSVKETRYCLVYIVIGDSFGVRLVESTREEIGDRERDTRQKKKRILVYFSISLKKKNQE